jgi:SEC-C motif-containing protein
MRSRYTAYTKGDVDYIVATHDPEHADRLDREATEEWAKEATWLGLDILACEQGQPGDETGTVEFVARYEQRGSERAHHERSTFRNVDGAWFFRDGDLVKPQPLKRAQPKVGRNEPCPCGSGKKYKKCCGSPSA